MFCLQIEWQLHWDGAPCSGSSALFHNCCMWLNTSSLGSAILSAYQPSHNILITKWKIPQMSPCVCLTARSHEKYLKKHHPIIVWLGFIITPNGLLNDWHLFTGWVMRWSLGLFHCWIINYYFIPIYVVSWHYASSKDFKEVQIWHCKCWNKNN